MPSKLKLNGFGICLARTRSYWWSDLRPPPKTYLSQEVFGKHTR